MIPRVYLHDPELCRSEGKSMIFTMVPFAWDATVASSYCWRQVDSKRDDHNYLSGSKLGTYDR
jgi:hypothetical protein